MSEFLKIFANLLYAKLHLQRLYYMHEIIFMHDMTSPKNQLFSKKEVKNCSLHHVSYAENYFYAQMQQQKPDIFNKKNMIFEQFFDIEFDFNELDKGVFILKWNVTKDANNQIT